MSEAKVEKQERSGREIGEESRLNVGVRTRAKSRAKG